MLLVATLRYAIFFFVCLPRYAASRTIEAR